MLLEIPYHNLDPVIFALGPLKVQWYGLSYMASFLLAYVLLGRMQRGGYLRISRDDVMSLLMHCIVGTIIGGRLGWVLFYSNFLYSGRIFSEPLILVGFEDGVFHGLQGLSFHGGLAGVALAGLLFCRSRAKSKGVVADSPDATGRQRFGKLVASAFDSCTLVAPLGIFLVRTFGNFVNGELYGRIITDEASAPAWAMRFPTSPEGQTAIALATRNDPSARTLPIDPELWQRISSQVPLRHPSQLYQALGEGLLVFLVLWFLRTKLRTRGLLGSAFLVAYGVARFPMEWFRQPDRQFEDGQSMSGWGSFLSSVNLTQGQLLCVVMIVAGLISAWLVKRSTNPLLALTDAERQMKATPFAEVAK